MERRSRFSKPARRLAGGGFALLMLAQAAAGKPAPPPAPSAAKSIVRLAPDFAIQGAGKTFPLKKLRGQPVVVLIAPSADAKPMREEAEKLEKAYLQFSAKKTVFVTALTAQPGWVASNIPFAPAQNGAAVGGAYGVAAGAFAIVIISPEGNVDMQSARVEPAQRVLDIINNSYQRQASQRTGLGS